MRAGLGQAGAGNARSKGYAKRVPATSQEAWPEAESLAMKDSLGREPWWNADRCAPLRWEARPWPMPRQNTNCVCRRSASDFLRSFRHPCRSGACECFHRHLLAAASHGAPNETGGDGSNAAV